MREKQRETERPRQRDKDRKTKNLTVKTVGLILLSQAPHCTTKYFKTNKKQKYFELFYFQNSKHPVLFMKKGGVGAKIALHNL